MICNRMDSRRMAIKLIPFPLQHSDKTMMTKIKANLRDRAMDMEVILKGMVITTAIVVMAKEVIVAEAVVVEEADGIRDVGIVIELDGPLLAVITVNCNFFVPSIPRSNL